MADVDSWGATASTIGCRMSWCTTDMSKGPKPTQVLSWETVAEQLLEVSADLPDLRRRLAQRSLLVGYVDPPCNLHLIMETTKSDGAHHDALYEATNETGFISPKGLT